MKKYAGLAVFLVLVFGSQLFAQEIGKLFSKHEADILFGKVLNSVEIDKAKLAGLTDINSDAFMFKISAGELLILDENRKTLYPDDRTVSEKEIFYYFSKSKVKEFLSAGATDVIKVEMRESTLTLTGRDNTLEQAMLCPPFCPVKYFNNGTVTVK